MIQRETLLLSLYLIIRSYINDEEMELFVRTVLSHNYQVLDIETSEHPLLMDEFRVIIDEDMCEIT